jgi:hypothetical protein
MRLGTRPVPWKQRRGDFRSPRKLERQRTVTQARLAANRAGLFLLPIWNKRNENKE